MKKWLDEFYSEPVVKQIVDNVGDCGYEDLTLQAMEICHGIQAYANDYNCVEPKIQDLWALLRKYNFSDATVPCWEENPYGKGVYEWLQDEWLKNGTAS